MFEQKREGMANNYGSEGGSDMGKGDWAGPRKGIITGGCLSVTVAS